MSLRLLLVIGLLAAVVTAPAYAGVSGRLHINASYSYSSIPLVPDKDVDFEASTEPQTLGFQQEFPNGAQPPVVVYARSANATMDGSDGELSGYADAELDGIPPMYQHSFGIYAEAYLAGGDYFTIESDVLDPGDEVEVTFRLAIDGNGPVSSQLDVDHILLGGGHTGVLHLSHEGGHLTGSFTAVVGELYEVQYYLKAYAGLTPFGLSTENPTKFNVSDYSARVYGGPAQPAVASLASTSGHDYTDPVPEPSAVAQGASVLLALGWRLRRARTRRTRERKLGWTHAAVTLLVLAFDLGVARAQSLENLVVNGEFDTNLASWTNLSGPKVWSPFDHTDDPESGSISISNTSGTSTGQFVQQCIPIVGGADYRFAYSHYSETAGVTTGRADAAVYWYDDPACTDPSITFSQLNSSAAPGAWNDLEDEFAAPDSAVAALVRLVARKLTGVAGDTWRVYYDHVQLVPEPTSVAQLVAACGALVLRGRMRDKRARWRNQDSRGRTIDALSSAAVPSTISEFGPLPGR